MHFYIVFALFYSLTLATPLQRAPQCSPNFQGVAMSIVSASGREWRPVEPVVPGSSILAPSANRYVADFRIEQSGQWKQPIEYIIKTVKDSSNSLVAKARSSGTLYLLPFIQTDTNQNWNILCDVCGTDPWNLKGLFSYGCKIVSAPTGKCVQVGPGSSSPLLLATCNGGSDQKFEFWTAYES